MKDYEISYESFMNTQNEQDFSKLITNIEEKEDIAYDFYPPQLSNDMLIRDGLTDALGCLGKSVQALIGLLEQNQILSLLPEPAVNAYSNILKDITNAAHQGVRSVNQSREFDETQLFSTAVPECLVLQ